MSGKRPSAKVLPFDEWKEVMRAAREPDPSAMMIAAAENAKLVEALAQRNREALDALDDIPSDTEVDR